MRRFITGPNKTMIYSLAEWCRQQNIPFNSASYRWKKYYGEKTIIPIEAANLLKKRIRENEEKHEENNSDTNV